MVSGNSASTNRMSHQPHHMDVEVHPALALVDLEASKRPSTFYYHNGRELSIIIGRIETFNMGMDIDRSTCGSIRSQQVEGVRITTKSGWSHKNSASAGVLDSTKYTQLVREVAKYMDFHLPPDRYDNGNQGPPKEEDKGRYMACHAEKKLSVWWVRKTLKALLSTRDMTRVAELKSIQVPKRFKTATIYLDHSFCCDNCVGFLQQLTAITGISFATEICPFFVKGERITANSVCGAGETRALPPATKATSRAKPSNPTEAQGLIYTSPPKDVGSQCFGTLGFSQHLDSSRMFPHLHLTRPPIEGSFWRKYRKEGATNNGLPEYYAKPPMTKMSEEDSRRMQMLSTIAQKVAGRRDPATSPTPVRHRARVQPRNSPTGYLEVHLRQMDASKKKEFQSFLDDGLSQASSKASSNVSSKASKSQGTRSIEQAKRMLDLKKFQYGSRSIPSPQNRVNKPQARSTDRSRQDSLRKRSIFARVFENQLAQVDLDDRE